MKRFFRGNIVTLSRDEKGTALSIQWAWERELLELCREIMYKEGSWYPLIRGVLPKPDPQGLFPLLNRAVSWEEFDGATPVGWRGPMVLVKHLKHLPQFVYCN